MRIESKVLLDFVEKVSVNGVIECVFDFGENDLSVNVMDQSNTTMVLAVLNKNNFVQYSPIGKVGFNNLDKLKGVLKLINSEVGLEKKDNTFVIKSKNNEVVLVLPHLDTLQTPSKLPELSFDISFNLDSKVLDSLVKFAEVVEKGSSILLTGSNKTLTIESGNDDKFREVLSIPEISSEVKVKFGEPLKRVVSVLDGNVTVSLKSDYPIKITSRNEQRNIVYIVAPLNMD